jgi:hypothetical protein
MELPISTGQCLEITYLNGFPGLVSGLRSGNKYLHILYLYAANSALIGLMTYDQDAENSSHLQTCLHGTGFDGFICAFRGYSVYRSHECWTFVC